ncbi:MAG: HTH domain-containing protein [Persephonella sp.]|nr:HTH domain-containing protein [Persephonella sp.]
MKLAKDIFNVLFIMLDSIDRFILNSIRERTVSGHKLSEALNISRTAVWKRVKKLESLGYTIEKSNRGYRLKKIRFTSF